MEKCVIKPRYESYCQGAGYNFIAHTPCFMEVIECDHFITLWGFLHLVDQTDEAVDKSDKIYKVRPDRMLPLFCRYYSPRQQLSLDEGMIPTKNRLAIKQYIRDKPVRWGIKSFLLCYILDAEIYTGQVRDCTGWSERVTWVNTQFHGDHVGPQNIPDHNNHESTALSFLELFLDADFWGLLCHQTNLRAEQVKQSKPASYYAKNFKPIAVPELKAFLGLRLQMEKCVIKPRYESYWQGAGYNFIAHTSCFREVIERDRFIALWGFLHLVDQTDEAVDKSDKIYKVRPMLDRMLPLFCRYCSPRQQLSLDEGMIPTKNRLAIKQYIRDKPVRWGIKSFLLCYILDTEIYTGQVRDRHWPLLGSAGSVVRRLVENLQVTNKNHMLFMGCFYNSVMLFHLLKNELGVLAAGTVMPSRKHYPKELSRRLTERGRYEFRCQGALCAISWKPRKPIHFLSIYMT